MNVFVGEYKRYKAMLESAVAQVDDAQFFESLGENGNAIAVIVKHLAGNLQSRFTDFLTTDGEKEWRDREGEFDVTGLSRDEIMTMWQEAWKVLETNVFDLSPEDMRKTVTIRGVAFSVEEALARSLAHLSYHVGQIIFMGKYLLGERWNYLTIPPGGSDAYNQNPAKEKGL